MKKILITTFVSLLIFEGVFTLILKNTWDGFKYYFFFGAVNAFFPFLIGCVIYHFLLESLSRKIQILKTLVGQIILGLLLSYVLLTMFLIGDKALYGTNYLSIVPRSKNDWYFLIGSGISVSIVYYLVSKFFIKETSIN